MTILIFKITFLVIKIVELIMLNFCCGVKTFPFRIMIFATERLSSGGSLKYKNTYFYWVKIKLSRISSLELRVNAL